MKRRENNTKLFWWIDSLPSRTPFAILALGTWIMIYGILVWLNA